jgi:beta-barrel assembly-enhancing protease
MKTGFVAFAILVLASCVALPPGDVQQPDPLFEFARQLRGGDFLADPALVQYVQHVGRKLAHAAHDERPYEFHVIDSNALEAWSLPGGKIAVSRGLLVEMHCESELAAVLTAEMARSYSAAEPPQRTAERGAQNAHGPQAMQSPTAADDSGTHTARRPQAMRNPAASSSDSELVVGNAIPATRVYVRTFDAGLPAEQTRDTASGCSRYENASKALRASNYRSDAKSHERLGDIAREQRQLHTALWEYETAASLNPRYYRSLLQAGLLHYQLKEPELAVKALNRSMGLLPTAPAAYHLGLIARDANDVQLAVQYFQLAASSDSSIGRSAARALVQLDLQHNPERYVDVRPRVDSSGNVWMVVSNHAPLTVDSVVVEAAVTRREGGVAEGPVRISMGGDALAPEGVAQLPTSLGPLANPRAIRLVRAEVQAAEAAR